MLSNSPALLILFCCAQEGKRPLLFNGYLLLARDAVNPRTELAVGDYHTIMVRRGGENPQVFFGFCFWRSHLSVHFPFQYSHLFLVLSWNLFNRSESTATIMYPHLSWAGDCLLVETPKSKGGD